jgi:hypothetical protein
LSQALLNFPDRLLPDFTLANIRIIFTGFWLALNVHSGRLSVITQPKISSNSTTPVLIL